jgi:PDZ domain
MSRDRMRSARVAQEVRTLALLIGALTAVTPTHGQTSTPSTAMRVLGLSVAASGGPRDTLGLLIAAVTRDGPADQAGITPGSRILAVNGALVRLAPSEIGRRGAADSALTHFDRVVRETAGATDVTLRIVGGGRLRTVSLPSTGVRRDAPRSGVTAVVRDTAAPAPVSAPPSAPRVASGSAAIGSVLESLAAAQVELRRMAGETQDIALSDSLAELDDALAGVRRRLRSLAGIASPAPVVAAPVAHVAPVPPAVVPMTAAPVRAVVNGLDVTTASADLIAYLGASAATALVVTQASEQWDPLRAGDVITLVDGADPDPARLRSALESRAPVTLTVRRRGRTFTVSFGSETQ